MFEKVRACVLGISDLRHHEAHITLARPRNPIAPGNSQDAARQLPHKVPISFRHVCRIEQRDNEAWRILDKLPIGTCT